MCGHVGPARVVGSCKVAACGTDVEAMVHTSPGQSCEWMVEATRSPMQGHVLSLEVKPTFLACVHEATWQASDAEMRKLACRARGTHAMFHVGTRHGFEFIFRG